MSRATRGTCVARRDGGPEDELAAGLLHLVAGVLLVVDPVGGAVGLTLLLAVFFPGIGVLRIALGLRTRRASGAGGGYVVVGVLDLLLGALIVLGWPETGAWVLGLFLGIELLVGGISILATATAARPATTRPA